MIRFQVVVCEGTECKCRNSSILKEEFTKKIKEYGLGKKVSLFTNTCFGFCDKGPVVIVYQIVLSMHL